uniref:Secreted protein n=1 Tax=Chromera velia CCMP2878 TaxID=1169474 RepID=A0A0G4HF50_9ALVE|eukprot:Cvel_6628.t1-p1 / transcript=Cvel_6628.t1 / gene=Cvel_6628 / organism=Chromera_velia_CCMP2878 / gene_product=hypothetical protein / transcript_product=hypothetical protein / location=Cvel_scaffold328:51040-54099(-) / protein_length=190 / sequence_SO=supercontig / SO=protein_coding / is_pseudo=false
MGHFTLRGLHLLVWALFLVTGDSSAVTWRLGQRGRQESCEMVCASFKQLCVSSAMKTDDKAVVESAAAASGTRCLTSVRSSLGFTPFFSTSGSMCYAAYNAGMGGDCESTTTLNTFVRICACQRNCVVCRPALWSQLLWLRRLARALRGSLHVHVQSWVYDGFRDLQERREMVRRQGTRGGELRRCVWCK